jgi:HEPN domain-containing protein
MREITQKWLEEAGLDIESIAQIIQNDRLTGHVAFHAQQAIEKALKALIEESEIRVPKIHSLSKLFSLCSTIIDFNPDEDIVIALDSLYIESRYPGEFGLLPGGKPTQNQAQMFYDFAMEVFLSVKTQLERNQ